MGGEDRVELHPVRRRCDFIGGETELDQPAHRLREAFGAGRAVLGQVIDPMDLLGGVGEMEIGCERADKLNGANDIGVAERIREFLPDRVVALPECSGQGAHVLDLFKEFGTHLAYQGVAELAPQTSDVAAKGGVELVEIVGHDAQPTELDPAAVRVIDPRQKLRGGWAGPRGYPTRPCSGRARSPRPQPSPPPEGQRTLGCRADRRR